MRVIGIDPSFRACGISDGEHHCVFITVPRDTDRTQSESIRRRCDEIVNGIVRWIREFHDGPDPLSLYIEAPAFGQASQASHLYEIGWLMNDLHTRLPDLVGRVKRIEEVSTTTIRKWATGKGNTPKDGMKLAVYKRFGVEFESDPGCDRLFAFLLCRFGEAVERGEADFTPSRKRGAKRRRGTPPESPLRPIPYPQEALCPSERPKPRTSPRKASGGDSGGRAGSVR